MLTSELLEAHRDALKEKEGTIAELLRRVEDLDHKTTVQQGREMELERLQGESRERETLLKQLSEAQGELEKKDSELQRRNSE